MLEVRSLPVLPREAGVRLSQVIQTDLNPTPLATTLRQAAATQSRACLEYDGCGKWPLPLNTR